MPRRRVQRVRGQSLDSRELAEAGRGGRRGASDGARVEARKRGRCVQVCRTLQRMRGCCRGV